MTCRKYFTKKSAMVDHFSDFMFSSTLVVDHLDVQTADVGLFALIFLVLIKYLVMTS